MAAPHPPTARRSAAPEPRTSETRPTASTRHTKAKLRAETAARREANAKPCPYCGDPMTHPRRVQCGKPECKRLWTNERNLAWQRRRKAKTGEWYGRTFTYERTCEGCGEPWITVHSQSRFCSTACANTRRQYEVTCEGCGQQWVTKSSNKARWCSPSCATLARSNAERERQRTAWLPVVLDVQLERAWCLVPERHPSRQHTPTPRLFVQGACIYCGTPFCVHSETGLASYCSTGCYRRDSKHRYRARKYNAYVAPVHREQIFERDQWRCGLCGEPTERDAVVPHPLAPVLDHIIPLAAGGTHEPSNAQCAHFLCNSRKGDRGGGEQLMLIG